jgi:chromosomal replication initiator protein
MCNYSYKDIGQEFGNRDHSTVMHSIDKVEQRMEKDNAFAELVKTITSNINSRK